MYVHLLFVGLSGPSEGPCIVQAYWVSEEQVEASQQWIDFIREDEQQRAFDLPPIVVPQVMRHW